MIPIFDSFWNTYIKNAIPLVSATIGALGGGIVSGFLVQLLTQTREREKWILDAKKQEYRELLSALSDAYIVTLSSTLTEILNDKERREKFYDAQDHSRRLFRDRIFINSDLNLRNLAGRWHEAIKFANGGPKPMLHHEYDAIRDEIVAAANRAVPKTTMQRLQFWRE
jgi:hypothetical protein